MSRKRNTKFTTIIAQGTCPDCGRRVTGKMPPNECCFTTFCEQCNEFKLEDSIDWDQEMSNHAPDSQGKPARR